MLHLLSDQQMLIFNGILQPQVSSPCTVSLLLADFCISLNMHDFSGTKFSQTILKEILLTTTKVCRLADTDVQTVHRVKADMCAVMKSYSNDDFAHSVGQMHTCSVCIGLKQDI